MTAPKSPLPWRTGRKVFRTIYSEPLGPEGKLIGVMDHAEDAAWVVELVNEVERHRLEIERLRQVMRDASNGASWDSTVSILDGELRTFKR